MMLSRLSHPFKRSSLTPAQVVLPPLAAPSTPHKLQGHQLQWKLNFPFSTKRAHLPIWVSLGSLVSVIRHESCAFFWMLGQFGLASPEQCS